MALLTLLILFGLAAIGWTCLLLPPTEREAVHFLFIRIVFGLLLLSAIYMLKEFFALPTSTFLIPLLAGAAILLVKRLRPRLRGWHSGKLVALALASCAIWLLPSLLHAYYAIGADAPGMFYNVDQTYFLSFVHEFAWEDAYPPRFILSAHEGFNYHYGTMLLAGMLSEVLDVAPHLIFLGVLPVLGVVAVVVVLFEVFQYQLRQPYWSLFAAVAALLAGEFYIPNYFDNTYRLLISTGRYYSQAYQSPSLFGWLLAAIAFLACQRLSQRGWQRVAVAALILLPLYKFPFAPLVGLGVGLYSLSLAYRTNNWRLIWVPLAGGLGMGLTYLFFVHNPGIGTTISFGFLGLFTANQIFSVALCLLLIGYCAATALNNKLQVKLPRYYWFFALPFLLVGAVIEFSHRDGWQIVTLVPAFLWLATVTYTVLLVRQMPSIRRRLILLLPITVVMGLPLLGSGIYSMRMLQDPSFGHEYVDNQRLQQVLQDFPVEGVILVTNDLRYPANDSIRNERQFQISALYGHECFNCELTYSRQSLDALDNRLSITEMIQTPGRISPAFDTLRKRYNITHVLVQRSYPHADFPDAAIIQSTPYYTLLELQ